MPSPSKLDTCDCRVIQCWIPGVGRWVGKVEWCRISYLRARFVGMSYEGRTRSTWMDEDHVATGVEGKIYPGRELITTAKSQSKRAHAQEGNCILSTSLSIPLPVTRNIVVECGMLWFWSGESRRQCISYSWVGYNAWYLLFLPRYVHRTVF